MDSTEEKKPAGNTCKYESHSYPYEKKKLYYRILTYMYFLNIRIFGHVNAQQINTRMQM